MSNPRDRKALAKKKSEAMDRFWRDYDERWRRVCEEAECAERERKSEQYILNLETKDDES